MSCSTGGWVAKQDEVVKESKTILLGGTDREREHFFRCQNFLKVPQKFDDFSLFKAIVYFLHLSTIYSFTMKPPFGEYVFTFSNHLRQI